MKRKPKPEVYAFIDSQNLNVGVQNMGWKMNWQRFRKYLADKYGVTKAFMFIGYVPEFEDMYMSLHEAGYSVVLKPTYDMTRPRIEAEDKPKSDNEEKKATKGNIDADLVLWAMKELPHYDKAVLVSGDGDFYVLVEYLVKEGKLLKLLTPNRHYSSLYNRYEPFVERLDTQRRILAYRSIASKKSSKPKA